MEFPDIAGHACARLEIQNETKIQTVSGTKSQIAEPALGVAMIEILTATNSKAENGKITREILVSQNTKATKVHRTKSLSYTEHAPVGPAGSRKLAGKTRCPSAVVSPQLPAPTPREQVFRLISLA